MSSSHHNARVIKLLVPTRVLDRVQFEARRMGKAVGSELDPDQLLTEAVEVGLDLLSGALSVARNDP